MAILTVSKLFSCARDWGLGNIDKATIIDPENHPKKEEYAQMLFQLRQKKGMTIEEARKLVLDPLYLGCLIIKSGDADGQLAGARNTTGDVLRPALQIIKTAPGITCVSGAMLLLTHAPEYGKNGILVMGDVAVTPVPTAAQLAEIAISTARTAKAVAGIDEPKVALLSFSTKGSAKHAKCCLQEAKFQFGFFAHHILIPFRFKYKIYVGGSYSFY